MPALNYKAEFAPKVEDGTKRSTIRPRRKNPIKKGDTLYHYTGMRTKKCRKLLENKCTSVSRIEIFNSIVAVNCCRLHHAAVYRLARKEGFKCVKDFRDFFRNQYGLPFVGAWIQW